MKPWKMTCFALVMAILVPINAYADMVVTPLIGNGEKDGNGTMMLVICGVAIVAVAIAAFVMIRRNRAGKHDR